MWAVIEIVIFGVLVLCAAGTLIFCIRSIQSFYAERYLEAVKRLAYAVLLGGVVFVIIAPAILRPIERPARRGCQTNLSQLVKFIKLYACDHSERYPATFDDLIGSYFKPGDQCVLFCPSSHHRAGALTNIHSWTDYAYVSGLTDDDPAGCVVAFCLPENHKREGANVIIIGGKYEWYPCKASAASHQHTFQELTNTPSLFYGTTNETVLADLKKRTKIIYPHHRKP